MTEPVSTERHLSSFGTITPRFLMQIEDSGVLRNTNWSRNPIIFFPFPLSYPGRTYAVCFDIEEKGKHLGNSQSLSFPSLLTHQWAEGRECWLDVREAGSEIKKKKIVEVLLFSISIVLGRTKYISVYELQNTNCVVSIISQCELHLCLIELYLFLYLTLFLGRGFAQSAEKLVQGL